MNIRFGGHWCFQIRRIANLGNRVFGICYGVRGSGVSIRIRLVAAVGPKQFSAQTIRKLNDFLRKRLKKAVFRPKLRIRGAG